MNILLLGSFLLITFDVTYTIPVPPSTFLEAIKKNCPLSLVDTLFDELKHLQQQECPFWDELNHTDIKLTQQNEKKFLCLLFYDSFISFCGDMQKVNLSNVDLKLQTIHDYKPAQVCKNLFPVNKALEHNLSRIITSEKCEKLCTDYEKEEPVVECSLAFYFANLNVSSLVPNTTSHLDKPNSVQNSNPGASILGHPAVYQKDSSIVGAVTKVANLSTNGTVEELVKKTSNTADHNTEVFHDDASGATKTSESVDQPQPNFHNQQETVKNSPQPEAVKQVDTPESEAAKQVNPASALGKPKDTPQSEAVEQVNQAPALGKPKDTPQSEAVEQVNQAPALGKPKNTPQSEAVEQAYQSSSLGNPKDTPQSEAVEPVVEAVKPVDEAFALGKPKNLPSQQNINQVIENKTSAVAKTEIKEDQVAGAFPTKGQEELGTNNAEKVEGVALNPEMEEDGFEESDDDLGADVEHEQQELPEEAQDIQAAPVSAVIHQAKETEKSNTLESAANEENMEELDGGSYFFSYFMVLCVFFVLGYVGYHNRIKVMALVLEGKRNKRQYRGRRPNSANYHKLDSNLEEAISSTCTKNANNVIY